MSGTLCHTTSQVPSVSLPSRTPTFGVTLARAVDTVLNWHERVKSRRVLAALDDRMLRDVGIDHATARREVERPFWQ
jgi:uncharacterized protein YjiS (DUF1127 family)